MKIIDSRNLLLFLSEYLPSDPVIIEAGAFNGIDTKKMALFWPNSVIHAFEPVPEIFKELVSETASYHQIKQYHTALSNVTGVANFYIAEHPKRPHAICQAGSLHKPKDRLQASPIIYPRTIAVNTITLADWAKKHTITSIDFIWLDMQGHELAVLQASIEFIRKASLIYIEVNFIDAYENQPSYEQINTWMESQGFVAIGQDFNDKPNRFFGNIVYKNKVKI